MVTEKSVKELENSQAALTLTIDAASIEDAYTKRIQKYAKELTLPGFRKGHVPASVIERKYGDSIREESTFDTMESALQDVIKELDAKDKPLPFATPVLQDEEKLLPFKKGEDITFTVVYDVRPSFEVPKYTGLEVDIPAVEVTDKDIDSEVEKLRNQNAVVKNKSGKAKNGDIATITYAELDEEGNEIESTKRSDFTFTIGSGYNFYKLDKDVVGMKKDDTKTVEKTYTEEDNVPGYAGKTVKLSVHLTELKERELPEVDDDFAQDIKDEYKTVQDMRDGIKKDLEKKVEDVLKNEKEEALMKAITENTSFTIPESMIGAELDSRWRNFVRSSQLSEDQILKFLEMQGETKENLQAEWRTDVESMLRTQLVLDAIREKENFEISEDDLNAECEKQLKNVPDSEKDSYKEIIRDNMQFEKVVPFLLENNKFKEGKKVSYTAYTNPSVKD